MLKLLKKIKEKLNKNVTHKVFLLVSWNDTVPQIIKRSTNSNLLYKLLDFDKNQEVLTAEEYQELINN